MAAPRPQRPTPGSRRAPQDTGGGERVPRGEYVAPPKKGAPAALMIGMLALIVVFGGIFIYGLATKKERQTVKPVVTETTNDGEWQAIKRKIAEAEKLYLETVKLRTDDDKFEEFNQRAEEVIGFMSEIRDDVELMLEPVRSEDGSLPEEYVGYLAETKKVGVWMEDLVKSMGF